MDREKTVLVAHMAKVEVRISVSEAQNGCEDLELQFSLICHNEAASCFDGLLNIMTQLAKQDGFSQAEILVACVAAVFGLLNRTDC